AAPRAAVVLDIFGRADERRLDLIVTEAPRLHAADPVGQAGRLRIALEQLPIRLGDEIDVVFVAMREDHRGIRQVRGWVTRARGRTGRAAAEGTRADEDIGLAVVIAGIEVAGGAVEEHVAAIRAQHGILGAAVAT